MSSSDSELRVIRALMSALLHHQDTLMVAQKYEDRKITFLHRRDTVASFLSQYT